MTRANDMSNTHRSPAPAEQVPASQHKPTKVLKKVSSSTDTEWQQKTLQSKGWDQNSSCTGGENSRSLKRLIYIQGTSGFANDPDKESNGLPEHKTAKRGMCNHLFVWEKIKKGRTAGITDQDAEDTGKETAMNFWNSLLLQWYNQDKYCCTKRASSAFSVWPWSWPVTFKLKPAHAATRKMLKASSARCSVLSPEARHLYKLPVC